MIHNEHLEKKYGVGFHTISVPRICPAGGTDIYSFAKPVDDATFAKIVALIRIAVPYTGMILSTRENHDMRKKLLRVGISQLSAGSSTEVGGYSKRQRSKAAARDTSQFLVNDDRSALSIIAELMGDGYVPSFCTACYRSGRTGDRFMSLAKSGQIGNVCLPNALMTLCEYSMDYGDDAFREKVFAIIDREIPNIADAKIRERTIANVEKIRSGGGRDFFV